MMTHNGEYDFDVDIYAVDPKRMYEKDNVTGYYVLPEITVTAAAPPKTHQMTRAERDCLLNNRYPFDTNRTLTPYELIHKNVIDFWRLSHSNIFPRSYNCDGLGRNLPMPCKFGMSLLAKDPGRDFMDRLAAANLDDPTTAKEFMHEVSRMIDKNKRTTAECNCETELTKESSSSGKTHETEGTTPSQTLLNGDLEDYFTEGQETIESLRLLQKTYRTILDLLCLYDRKQQIYGTFTYNTDYVSPDGTRRLTFKDPEMRLAFQRDARRYLNWLNVPKFSTAEEFSDWKKERGLSDRYIRLSSNGKKIIVGASKGLYEPAGDLSIVMNLDGSDAVWVDRWDYSLPQFEQYNGSQAIHTGDIIPQFDDIPTYPDWWSGYGDTDSQPSVGMVLPSKVDDDTIRWLGK